MNNWSNIIHHFPADLSHLGEDFPSRITTMLALWLRKVTGISLSGEMLPLWKIEQPKTKLHSAKTLLHLWFACLDGQSMDWQQRSCTSCTYKPICASRFGAVLPWNKHPQNRNRVAVRVLMQIYWLTYVSVIPKIYQDSDRKCPEHIAVRQLGPHLQLGQLCTGGTFQIHSQLLLLVTFLGWSV